MQGITVLISGASSGIGLACAEAFAERGARIILAARRREKLQNLSAELQKRFHSDILTLAIDVRDHQAVSNTIETLSNEWKDIDILVNNAGLARGLAKIHEGDVQDWNEMIDTNVKGLLSLTRAVTPLMISRKHGHIINIGSISGREVYPKGAVYCSTKYAVRAISEGLRIELLGTGVKVTSVDPGLVRTEFTLVRFKGDKDRAKAVYEKFRPLEPKDVADAVVYCASTPPHVNIDELLIMPTDQASSAYNVLTVNR